MVRLIHIAPELPPTVGGVADYTAILSRRLLEVSGRDMKPVLVHAGNQSAEAIETDFPTVDLSGKCAATALTETIERLAKEAQGAAVVLMEYSGYGYAKRGAPLWLARGLRRVCGTDGVSLITMFHEMSASSWKPWTSTFWLSPLQSWVASRVARLSNAVMATHPVGARGLESVVGKGCNVVVRPVFSNVGEPDEYPSWEQRDCLVLFGGQDEKEQIYEHAGHLRDFVAQDSVSLLVDIGPPPDNIPSFGIPCKVLGIQPAEAVSQWLGRARGGIVHRRLDIMTKSGLVAAYLAHGVPLVVLPQGPASRSPVLEEGTHYLTMDCAKQSSVVKKRISRQGYAWYQDQAHSQKQAGVVHRMIGTALETTVSP